MTPRRKQGFTLIELSIVLVIIGLIVGGVLVGRDLIRAAEIRSEISKVTSIETAINTFRLKYNGLPGDFNDVSVLPNVPVSHYGNGNGIIELNSGSSAEPVYAWEHLSKANLIPGAYDGDPNAANNLNCTTKTCPASAVNNADTLFISSTNGVLAYIGTAPIYNNPLTTYPRSHAIFWLNAQGNLTSNLKVSDVYAMDAKLDDGAAATGRFLTINDDWFATNACVTGRYYDTTSVYNFQDSNSDCFPVYILR